MEERYCGLTTWLISTVGSFPCSYFCPCDRRTVWIAEGNKVKVDCQIVSVCPAPMAVA